MNFKARYFCLDGSSVRKRSNTITLPFTTDKYETILEEVKKASSWEGEIVIHSVEEIEAPLMVGDVVKYVGYDNPSGYTGVIRIILGEYCTQPYLVEFSGFMNGHDGSGRRDEGGDVIVPEGLGWWCHESELKRSV